ncbi:PREDICTED: alpha-2-macroglobulin-like [Thamnophis sirtalis]|uniref:Alpha-2-macroglobulin-like n=1 Tax=Thamnophis sirtalis TaxID=35019 RepID=A0A6I9XC21_9SAUR|nr:PREDICTED: alpha-2-macroglobulin-like [Thamnophis sirtalis]
MGESWQHGKNIFLLLLLSVLLRTTEAAPEPKLQYVALVPSTIHMETPEHFCIQIKNEKGTVNLTLVLEPAIKDLILKQMTIKESEEDEDFLQCDTFQVPRESNISVPSEVLLEFRGNDLTHSFQIRKKVRIEKPKHLVFIQTDKPIYRAGQKVQFRIVSMDKKFHPMKKKFPVVYIQRFSIKTAWLDVSKNDTGDKTSGNVILNSGILLDQRQRDWGKRKKYTDYEQSQAIMPLSTH